MSLQPIRLSASNSMSSLLLSDGSVVNPVSSDSDGDVHLGPRGVRGASQDADEETLWRCGRDE